MTANRNLLGLLAAFALIAGGTFPAHALFWNHFGDAVGAEEPIPNPFPYDAALDAPGADRKLTKALTRASALLANEDEPPSGLAGLIARARQDIARLTGVLYQNARYEGEINITINGRALAEIGPFDEIGPSPAEVMINVSIGDLYRLGTVNAAPLPPGVTLHDIGLEPGGDAGSRRILAAEAALVAAWQEEGHPYARVAARDTVADHRGNVLDVTLHVDPGPRAAFGRVEVDGARTVDPMLIAGRSDLAGRGAYSPRAVDRAEKRVRDLGVFDSVRITPAASLDPDGTVPMIITVSERKPRVIGAGASYSSTDGLGLETYWRHRNLFGGAEQLQLSASVARLLDNTLDPDFRLAGSFIKPAAFGPLTDFTFRLEGYRETTESYRVTAVETEAGIAHIFSDTLTGSLSLGLERSRTIDDLNVATSHLPLTLTGKLIWDSTDDRLDPTTGHRNELLAAPTYDFETDTAYARLGTDYSIYRAIDDAGRFVLAGRIAASTLTVDDIAKVAPDKRLYEGGGGSVRGYGYKNIGPRNAAGNVIGGRSSVLLSGELRWRHSEQLGFVAFVDAGNAYSSILPGVDELKVGVGAGVRYFTPVGPIRLDVAVPLQPDNGDPSIAVYVGLGQAF